MRGKRHRNKTGTWKPISWGSTPKEVNLEFKAGDWLCKKCHAHNYAWRKLCHNCNSTCIYGQRCKFNSEEKMKLAASKDRIKPGDWQCSMCGEICYASKHKCYHCHTQRRNQVAIIAFEPIPFEHGDWFCKRCGFHNFCGRTHCFSCKRN